MKQQNISKRSVQHGRSRTRNQRKRERIETLLMGVAAILIWATVFCMMAKAWAEHPAERFVGGYEYMATLGGDTYENPQK